MNTPIERFNEFCAAKYHASQSAAYYGHEQQSPEDAYKDAVEFARTLANELQSAQSRIAELERERDEWRESSAGYASDLEECRDKLAAAERDAAIGKAIHRAAAELPEGYEIEIDIERGAGTVRLHDPYSDTTVMDVDADYRLPAEINAAIDAAAKQEGEKS